MRMDGHTRVRAYNKVAEHAKVLGEEPLGDQREVKEI